MNIPIAREGYPFIAAAAGPAVVLWAATAAFGGSLLWGAAAASTMLALAVAAFFRDPERRGPTGARLVLAPADGRVIEITEVEEPSYLGSKAVRISIFLSLFDVHVNRYPVSGDVEHRTYDAGRFEPAWRKSASHSNERASTGIRDGAVAILIRQIAGLAAKRIVTYANVGDRVLQGERMGLIRFGSRVDLFLPADAEISVSLRDRTSGGVTVVARLNLAGRDD